MAEPRKVRDITWHAYRVDNRLRRFEECTLHILIEASIDAAQHIIADKGFRESSSYRDTSVVLAEEGTLHPDDLPRLGQMAAFRTLLDHDYKGIEDDVVYMCS
ncbi:MAG: DUF86 domain-containing protein [Deltaproteobacteria bacterium]|nr:DUF86 domain-containing protein [Deltaproteobacteria bacterium]